MSDAEMDESAVFEKMLWTLRRARSCLMSADRSQRWQAHLRVTLQEVNDILEVAEPFREKVARLAAARDFSMKAHD